MQRRLQARNGQDGRHSSIEPKSKKRKIDIMNRDDVLTRLKILEPLLQEQWIERLYLYGSFAIDTADETSDIDLFVDPQKQSIFGFDAFMNSYDLFKSSFPDRELGYSTRDGLVEPYKQVIEPTAFRVF